MTFVHNPCRLTPRSVKRFSLTDTAKLRRVASAEQLTGRRAFEAPR